MYTKLSLHEENYLYSVTIKLVGALWSEFKIINIKHKLSRTHYVMLISQNGPRGEV